MSEREYVKNKLGHVGYLIDSDHRFHGLGYSASPVNRNELTRPSRGEIDDFENEEKRREKNRRKRLDKEKKLLSLCGLSHSDFVRFRDVYKDYDNPDILIVETRENGVNGRSVDAIRNENYLSSCADSYDTTYERYRFRVPE